MAKPGSSRKHDAMYANTRAGGLARDAAHWKWEHDRLELALIMVCSSIEQGDYEGAYSTADGALGRA